MAALLTTEAAQCPSDLTHRRRGGFSDLGSLVVADDDVYSVAFLRAERTVMFVSSEKKE